MQNQEYGGFWIRTLATLLDSVLLLVVIGSILTLIYGQQYWSGEKLYYGVWDGILNYVVPIVATVWFWRRFLGTPGKIVAGLKVVDAKTGNKLSVPQAIGRYFAYIPAMLPLGLGIIWVGFDKKKQGWHDKLAGTVVVKADEPVTAEAET